MQSQNATQGSPEESRIASGLEKENTVHASKEWIDLIAYGGGFPLCWQFPLHFQIVAKRYREFEFPSEMTGIWRYLNNAYARDEFTNTCPADQEIERAYSDVAKRMKWSWGVSALFLNCTSEAVKTVCPLYSPTVTTILCKIMPPF